MAVGAFTFISLSNVYVAHWAFVGFVSCATVFAYNYMRLIQIGVHEDENDFKFSAWVSGHRFEVLSLSVFFGILSLVFFKKVFQWELLYFIALPAVVSLVYPLTFKKSMSGFSSLRAVPGLKLFLISATWAFVTELLPIFLYGQLEWDSVLEFFFRTILVMGLVIPFDIRDKELDAPVMRTIPQVMGANKARELSLFFILIYQVWVIVRFLFFGASLEYMLALLIGLEIGTQLIKRATNQRPEGYFSFWIEGIPVYCAILLLVLRWFL